MVAPTNIYVDKVLDSTVSGQGVSQGTLTQKRLPR